VGAAGYCGCGGEVFEGRYVVIGAVDEVIPVDRHFPDCPPEPQALLAGLIALMTRAAAESFCAAVALTGA